MTSGFASLPAEIKEKSLQENVGCNAFTKANDPHGEHDFVSAAIQRQTFFAKIDHFDLTLGCGSENPADLAVTTRVMAITRADDY